MIGSSGGVALPSPTTIGEPSDPRERKQDVS
jgi:hypothetical protein